jgi:hypothetical protein
VPPQAIWRAGWALLLARLAGLLRVRMGWFAAGGENGVVIDERSESGGRGPAGSAGGENGVVIDERSESGGRGHAGSAGGEGVRPLVIDVPGAGELAPWLGAVATAAPAGAEPAPQSAWADTERGVTDGGPALIWHLRGPNGVPGPATGAPGAAIARFSGARIERATVERLGELLRTVMAGLLVPGARLEGISPLTAAERARVLDEWNQTEVTYRPEATVHALFREQAAANPDRGQLT